MTVPAVPQVGPRLCIASLSKRFGANRALNNVSLAVRPGQVHGLVGTNGSGKSTIVKILSGVYRADRGSTITVDGVPLASPVSPAQLQRVGLSFVHQDLGLVDTLSVTDNVRVGRYTTLPGSRAIRSAKERAATAATLAELGSDISPGSPVARLNAGERALVAVARALQGQERGKGCIVFDESTQVLPPESVEPFLQLLRALAQQGTSIVLVSHRLDEIMAVTDRITVLRDGAVAGELTTRDSSETDVARLMLGISPSRDHLQSLVPTRVGRTVLSCTAVTGRSCRDVSFSACGGEVVGLTGSTGSGYEEFPYLLAGVIKGASGTVEVLERTLDLRRASPQRALQLGVGLIPKDRAQLGLALGLSVKENLTLPRVRRRSNRFLLSRRWQKQEYERAADELGIVPRDATLPVSHLSGGNQQKVLLAKWVLNAPAVLAAHSPTQAVDVGARRDILAALRRVAASGACVLISASEAEDLAAVCDRVVIFDQGCIVTELNSPLRADQIRDVADPTREWSELNGGRSDS